METKENTTPENVKPMKVSKTPRLPTTEEDLKNLAQRVLAKWQTDKMEVRYKKIADFEKDVQAFADSLSSRGDKGDQRKPVSKQLRDLDKEIDLHIEDVKVYIKADKGAKQAEPFYPQFGIEKVSKGYKFPADRDARLRSLKKIVQALTAHQMTTQSYGKTYWEGILSQYQALLEDTNQADSEISGKVREKNNAKSEVRKVLNCLMKLIEGHYPDDYESVWREWGFQRGKY